MFWMKFVFFLDTFNYFNYSLNNSSIETKNLRDDTTYFIKEACLMHVLL